MFSMTPKTWMCMRSAILMALETIKLTKSCGDVTIIKSSTGRLWKIVKATSPVPGIIWEKPWHPSMEKDSGIIAHLH